MTDTRQRDRETERDRETVGDVIAATGKEGVLEKRTKGTKKKATHTPPQLHSTTPQNKKIVVSGNDAEKH